MKGSIIKNQKEKELEAEHKKYWRFPDRDCEKCSSYKCFRGQDAVRCNFAKYGCVDYNN